MRAAFDDPPLIEHNDLVGVDDRRQPVSNDNGRATFGNR